MDQREFEREYHKGICLTTIAEIEIEGKKVKAIAHKIETDPVTDRPTHIDFFNVDENKVARAKPKLVFAGKDKSPGLKKGGFLHTVLRRAELICKDLNAIPHELEVDASKLHLGDKITSDSIKLPAGTEFAKKSAFLIASITGRGKSEEESAATSPVEGEASAEGDSAPAESDKKAAEEKK